MIHMDAAKLKRKFLWQTVVIVVGSFLLVAELIVLVVLLVGRPHAQKENKIQTTAAPTKAHVVVPDAPPVKSHALGPEDFAYEGDYLACITRDYELGVDVSHYQGDIDWEQVRDAGFTFAIIRVGGRGYGAEGNLFADAYAQQNYEGAKAAGIKVGAYFFSQAINEMEAEEEAHFALQQIIGWDLDLPLVYDWEYISSDARTGEMEENNKILFTKAFCQVIEDAGIQPMVYVAPWASEDYMMAVQDYPVWLVLYSDQMTFGYHFDYWQYTCTGSVPGISGDVDIDLYIPPEEK